MTFAYVGPNTSLKLLPKENCLVTTIFQSTRKDLVENLQHHVLCVVAKSVPEKVNAAYVSRR